MNIHDCYGLNAVYNCVCDMIVNVVSMLTETF